MIKVFGFDIKGAYTGGIPVKEIYSYGVKVWPEEGGLPEGYTELKYIYNDLVDGSSTTPPFIKIQLPEELSKYRIVFTYANVIEYNKQRTSPIIWMRYNINYGNNQTVAGVGYIDGYYNTMGPSGGPEWTLTAGYNFTGMAQSNSINTPWNQEPEKKRTAVITQGIINADGVSKKLPTTITFGQTTYDINSISLTEILISRSTSFNFGFPYLYRFKLYGEGDILLMDLIPAKNTSTNRAGMYDLVNEVFYDGHYYSDSKNFKYANLHK